MPASIWLQLSGDADRSLRALIADLAQRHGTMAFQPHLTVSSIAPDDRTVFDAAAAFVQRCRALPLRAVKAGISHSTTAPFKAVVVDLENRPELQAFREELRRIAGAAPFEPPHISLLYTIDAAQKVLPWAGDVARLQRIAAEAACHVLQSDFSLDAPIIVAPDGEWTNIASWTVLRRL
jgi:2'-5' RNA ligase